MSNFVLYFLLLLLLHSQVLGQWKDWANDYSNNGILHYNAVEESKATNANSSRRLASNDISQYSLNTDLTILYDPPTGFQSPTALGVYVEASNINAKVYYEIDGTSEGVTPTLDSPYATFDSPYIHIELPYAAHKNRTLTMIAVEPFEITFKRSISYTLHYVVESADRPNSFGFLVPGVESKGIFIRVGLEMKAQARAQTAGGQEFADFNTKLAIGTYADQVRPINLPLLDPDLTGFEGGFAVNCTGGKHYGILIPHHNGEYFFGKVVRVDLQLMENTTYCKNHYRYEYYDKASNSIKSTGVSKSQACIFVLDLASVNENARGFRKGFAGYPYGYLSPGEFTVAVRLDMEDFELSTVKMVDLSTIDASYGGYSGGFTDGSWACFNPFRSFIGPVGGRRSSNPADTGSTKVFYQSTMVCVNSSIWTSSLTGDDLSVFVRELDFSKVQPGLRGFSEVLRVGRYAYFAPLLYTTHIYTSNVLRLYLGRVDIGETYDALVASNGRLRDLVTTLDVSQKDASLRGFSGLFNAGQYLFLVPYRNFHTPANGQRGHGGATRINLNQFSLDTTIFVDLSNATRAQIPSFADVDLVGYSGGFASGKYGVLTPFFNGIFSGKMARFTTLEANTLAANVQELDLTRERNPTYVGRYKGYRGGFVSLWSGTDD